MKIRAYCRIPEVKSSSIRSKEGSCPELLHDLFQELEGAEEIHIAAYLFNNPTYFSFLKSLTDRGCKVRITSLPINGYSNKPLKVEGFAQKLSARDFAIQVYEEISKTSGFDLRIFPHLYMWYGALYADGGASYSFHVKAIYAKFRGNKKKCILASGNFMVTDPYHSDNFIVIERSQYHEKSFAQFFQDLEKYSIDQVDFNKRFKSPEDEFAFAFGEKEKDLVSDNISNCFFSSPFYLIDGKGSNHYAGDRIIELIGTAKKRVWICAQHFHDVLSFDPERKTIIDAISRKATANKRLDLRFLKQVPHSSLADKRRAAISETLFQYVLNAKQRYNRFVHDKFIIVDNSILVSTANYTSTQFAFGKRTMKMNFGKTPRKKVDNFSEVNGFLILPDCPGEILSQYEDHFNSLWDKGQDIVIKL